MDARTVERDYVIHHILAAVGTSSGSLVFKGGTSLRACHFEDYRYSADLDFSLLSGSADSAEEDILTRFRSYSAATGFSDVELSRNGSVRIACRAVLGRGVRIKVDVSEDELVEETAMTGLRQRYADLPNTELLTYTLNEVLAEKLRCVIQRTQCRDLFDLHTLWVEREMWLSEAVGLFGRKCSHKKVDPNRFGGRLEAVCSYARRQWNDELSEFTRDPPPFNTVERQLRRALRDLV